MPSPAWRRAQTRRRPPSSRENRSRVDSAPADRGCADRRRQQEYAAHCRVRIPWASPVQSVQLSVADCGGGSRRQQRLHLPALFLADHAEEKLAHNRLVGRSAHLQSACNSFRLQLIEAACEACTLVRHAQPPLAAIIDTRLLRDPTFIDELFK